MAGKCDTLKSSLDGSEGELEVSNLTRNVKSEHLQEIFSTYGAVKSVDVRIDSKSGVSKGSAVVVFHKENEAEVALCHLDGGYIDGNVVKVSYILVSNKRKRGASVEVDRRRPSSRDRVNDNDRVRRESSRDRGRDVAVGNYRNRERSPAATNNRFGSNRLQQPVNRTGRSRSPFNKKTPVYVPKDRPADAYNRSNRDNRDIRDIRGNSGRFRSRSRDRRRESVRSPIRSSGNRYNNSSNSNINRGRSRTRSRSPVRGRERGRRSYSRSGSASRISSSESDRSRRRRRRSSSSRSSGSYSRSSRSSSSSSSYSSRSTRSSFSSSRSRSRSHDNTKPKPLSAALVSVNK